MTDERKLAREHIEAIEAALVQVNQRLIATKQKFERAFNRSDSSDPQQIGLELERAAFELELRRLSVMREAAKAQYLRTFQPAPNTDSSES